MDIYACRGFDRFVLAAGYKGELIEEFAAGLPTDWEVEVVHTGEDTETGERVARCRDRLDELFFLTYGDGLANVDLGRLLSFHRSHSGCATVTVVPLPSPYGTIETDARKRVFTFKEKPLLTDHWINGGFFVMEQRVFDRWEGVDLEREVLPRLAEAGELYAYRHEGFWKSLDTYKDALALSALSIASGHDDKGASPWLRFETPAPF
jgi:glucose-1-phosphate cytidylyltransferase